MRRAGACAMAAALLAGETSLGFSAARPSGHHAEPDRAMGFCLFNNVAIAAELAIRELGAERVFILDWDVHHGNGTAEAFRRRADVLFASIHQAGIYPGQRRPRRRRRRARARATRSICPSRRAAKSELWLSLLEHIVLPAATAFAPDLVLVSAGFDAHRADPLAGCRLETESFAEMARHVHDIARRSSACRSGWCSRAATNPPRWPSACRRRSRRSPRARPRPLPRPRAADLAGRSADRPLLAAVRRRG